MRLPLFCLAFLCLAAGSVWADDTSQLTLPPSSPSEFHEQEATRWRLALEARDQLTLDETQLDYDVRYYELWVDLRNYTGRQIAGRTDVYGTALTANFRDVVLDLCDTLSVDSVRGAGNTTLAYSRGSQQIVVSLERDYALNEDFALTIYYHGTPCLGGGISTFDWYDRFVSSYVVPSIHTLSEPFGARDWWPCKDVPSDKADSARIHLTVSDTLVATSNGVLQSVTPVPSNALRYSWFESNPISTYLIVANASNYQSFTDWYVNSGGDSLPIVYYVYPEKLAAAQTDWDFTPDIITVFAEKFGEYPFMDEKYGHSMFRWSGGMEHQCNTSMGSGIVSGFHWYDYITVHELAHMWWGDMVTLDDWPDIWLNEGFASYSEAVWVESQGGAAALRSYMISDLVVNDPSGPVYNPASLFSSNTVYHKGAWVLHTLRGAIRNDSLFFAGLREYRARYQYSTATTAEFLAAMSDVAGYDVTPFVYGYLYLTNRPSYRYSYGTGMCDGVLTTAVRLRQIHATPAQPFTNRVDLRFGGAQTVTQTVVSNSYRAEYLFNMGYTPSSIALDPDEWMLETKMNEPLQPIFLNAALTIGTEGAPYADTLVAIGGASAYTFTLIGGALPTGITLGSNGIFAGTPSVSGNFPLTLRVNNTSNQSDTTQLVLNVLPVLDAPEELTILANGDDTVTLRWIASPDALHYDVMAATLADYSDLVILATVTDTFYVDAATVPEKYYMIIARP
ncbi:MAG: M1 family metallopeptidase [bacterium]|nr:M1 family metallopeptidase [bacterium]